MTLDELEQRIKTLEAEVQLLKMRQDGRHKANPKWVLAHAGRFENDPGFAEVVRLGREYRESLRPGRKKKSKSRSHSKAKAGDAHS